MSEGPGPDPATTPDVQMEGTKATHLGSEIRLISERKLSFKINFTQVGDRVRESAAKLSSSSSSSHRPKLDQLNVDGFYGVGDFFGFRFFFLFERNYRLFLFRPPVILVCVSR